MTHILIVEDTIKIAKNTKLFLETRGYEVSIVHDGISARAYLEKTVVDMVILDIMLPGIDGYEVCRYSKRIQPITGVIMITAKATSIDTIKGLDTGADDYLTKPFSLDVLEARMRALSRRLHPSLLIQVDDIRIDCVGHTAYKNNQELVLTAKQMCLLEYLAIHQGIFLSRTDLIEYMRGGESIFEGDEKLDVSINRLRKKIGKHLIETRKGFGYRLINIHSHEE